MSDDSGGFGIGQGSFQPVADFYPDLAFLNGHQEQHAVVGALLPKAPGGGHTVGKFFEWFSCQGSQREHGNLVGGLVFVGNESLIERGKMGREHHVSLVHYPAGQWRNVYAPCRLSNEEEGQKSHPTERVHTSSRPKPH